MESRVLSYNPVSRKRRYPGYQMDGSYIPPKRRRKSTGTGGVGARGKTKQQLQIYTEDWEPLVGQRVIVLDGP
eukprot:UN08574